MNFTEIIHESTREDKLMTTDVMTEGNRYAVWGMPGTLIWGLIVFAAFSISHFATLGLYIGLNYPDIDVTSVEYEALIGKLQYNGTIISIATLTSLLICTPMMMGIIKLKKQSNIKEYLGLKSVDIRTLGLWLALLIGLSVLADFIAVLMGKPVVPQFMKDLFTSTELHWLLWLALVVAAPVFEELFFRGFLISGFSSTFLKPVGAVVITSVLWTAVHMQYDWFGLLLIFVMGLLLGLARIRTGSVFLAIYIHALANLIATMQAAYAV